MNCTCCSTDKNDETVAEIGLANCDEFEATPCVTEIEVKPPSQQNGGDLLKQESVMLRQTSPSDASSRVASYRSKIAQINARLADAKRRLRDLQAKGASPAPSESGVSDATALTQPTTDHHQQHKTPGRLSQIDDIIEEEKGDGENWEESPEQRQKKKSRASIHEEMMRTSDVALTPGMNREVITGSALGYPKIIEVSIFAVAIGGIVFALIAEAEQLGHSDEEGHRRLAAATPVVVKDVCWIVATAGVLATIAHGLYLPLVLGYLLGGFIVGPVGFDIVVGGPAMIDMTRLGVLFVLFLLGLEVDTVGLWQSSDKKLVGFLSVPLCSGVVYLIFLGFDAAGISFGSGEHTVLYCAVCSSFSSMAIVTKLLFEKNQMEAAPSTLSCGILMMQALWSIVVFALQPHVDHGEAVDIVKAIGWIVLLIGVNYMYARCIVPSALYSAEQSIELLLVISLAWCFFVASIGLLPFIELPMEVSALLAGVALASFPYSLGFTQKIKYIRDFFLTLFFASLGSEMPTPKLAVVGKAFLVAGLVLIMRWLCIFLVALPRSGGRSAAIATLNLSQLGELPLILCMIGKLYNHIDDETQAIFVWAFCILAVISSLFIAQSELIWRTFMSLESSMFGGKLKRQISNEEYQDSRAVLLLGFSKVSHMCMAEWKASDKGLLQHVHIMHPDPKKGMKDTFSKVGVKFTNADFSSKDDLKKSQEFPPEIAICTTPGTLLAQISISNEDLIKAVKEVWPECLVVVMEESPAAAKVAYEAGADYVVRMARLCASRLIDLLGSDDDTRHGRSVQRSSELRAKDTDRRGGSVFWHE